MLALIALFIFVCWVLSGKGEFLQVMLAFGLLGLIGLSYLLHPVLPFVAVAVLFVGFAAEAAWSRRPKPIPTWRVVTPEELAGRSS